MSDAAPGPAAPVYWSWAHVGHRRRQPCANAFHHRLAWLVLDAALLDGRARLDCGLAVNMPGPLSLWRRDYGGHDGGAVRAWLGRQWRAAGVVAAPGDRVWLVTSPRVWGRTFNPVNFWCLMRGAQLLAVLVEVHNTFGGWHHYCMRHADGRAILEDDWLGCEKRLFVSPFFPPGGRYQMRFALLPGVRLRVDINYMNADGAGLQTWLWGRCRQLRRSDCLRLCLGRPLHRFRALALIHWQALRLWARGVPNYLAQRRGR